MNNVLKFTDSQVNILIATALADSTKDGEGTWVLNKMKYYIFNWYFGKYRNTRVLSAKFLPLLEI